MSFDIIKGDSIDIMCMQDNTNYNRNYKDSLFRFIFNNKEAHFRFIMPSMTVIIRMQMRLNFIR